MLRRWWFALALLAVAVLAVVFMATRRHDTILMERVVSQPAYALDGKAVVGVLQSDVWVRRQDGREAHYQLPLGMEALGGPIGSSELVVSPRGDRLICLSCRNRRTKPELALWEMDLADGQRKRLCAMDGAPMDGQYSPDGTRIAVPLLRTRRASALCVVDSASGQRKQVWETASAEVDLLGWSRDGERVYVSMQKGPLVTVLSIPAAGGRPTVLHTLDARALNLHAAPAVVGDRKVAYCPLNGGVSVVPFGGRKARVVARFPEDVAPGPPRISPSGKYVMVAMSRLHRPMRNGFLVARLDARRSEAAVMDSRPVFGEPVWHPKEDKIVAAIAAGNGEVCEYVASDMIRRAAAKR